MNQFIESHTVTFRPFDHSRKKDAQMILDQWREDVKHSSNIGDYEACVNALCNLETLGLFGFVYYAEQEPAGFILAKALFSKMCVLHFAKGKRKFKGIFEYMFHHFAHEFGNQFQYFNFEQDLGQPNFRKIKQSYIPDKLMHKCRVSIR